MSCVWMLQRGPSGDGCVLASTLYKYDLRNGDLFVLSWARVRRVRRESLSSELLVCGGGVRSILLLPLVARCLETIDVCMFLSCVHPVAVLNAAFCMTCSLLMLVEVAIGDHTEEAYSRAGLITAL